jgi:toxin YoeB
MGDLTFSEDAWDDYLYWQITDRAAARKLNGLLKELTRTPFEGTGKPEPLKNTFTGLWSRRISGKDRLVYEVVGDRIRVVQCKGHYDDK